MNNFIPIYKEPIFNDLSGYLSVGIYLMSIDDLLKNKILGGTPERINLINSLKLACQTYWYYGITEIYANGSFATTKPAPADIDGYIQVSFEDINFFKLVQSDSVWGKFKGKNNPDDKFPMWYEHKIGFYLHDPKYPNKNLNPPKFFTHSKENVERGIIKIIQQKGDI